MKCIPISWQQFEKDVILLGKKIRDEYGSIDEIIAISRGGIVAARILSDILDVKISFITIESYKSFSQQKDPIVTQKLDSGEAPLRGSKYSWGARMTRKKILLVDELADSGATFLRALAYLKKIPLTALLTASPYIKPATKYTPHFYTRALDGWVIFPYELKETKTAFIQEMGLEKAKKKLQELGITDWSRV